jgi:hypothetical protein
MNLSGISIPAKDIEACVRSGRLKTGCWSCIIEGSATVRGACTSYVLYDKSPH